MTIKDRVLVSGSKIALVFFWGPPQLSWVIGIEDTIELVESLIQAIDAADTNRKRRIDPEDALASFAAKK